MEQDQLSVKNGSVEPGRNETKEYSVPWKPVDHWVGVFLLALIDAALFVAAMQGAGTRLAQNAGLILIQLAYLLPLIVIFAYRRVNPKSLGFGMFEWSTLALGCGLLIVSYLVILVHNVILTFLFRLLFQLDKSFICFWILAVDQAVIKSRYRIN